MLSNIQMVTHVASKLGPLRKQLVFVGGSIVEFLLDKTYPLLPRVTKDVDTIVEVCGHSSFYQIEDALRKQGFKNNVMSDIICRWEIDGIILDVMPTDSSVLGFSNIWYQDAIKHAQSHFLGPQLDILLIRAPYFLATKLEAFENRGQQDYYGSPDIEDIITLLDGRDALFYEIQSADKNLKLYLINKFNTYQNNVRFIDALPGHLSPYKTGTDERVERVINIIARVAEIKII